MISEPQLRSDLVDLLQSGVFDPEWYLSRYPDAAGSSMSPIEHFIRFGWHEGRDPSPWFSTQGYLAERPDVLAVGMNPVLHYLRFGWREGTRPRPEFDSQAYAWAHGLGARVCPLVHELAQQKHRVQAPERAEKAAKARGC